MYRPSYSQITRQTLIISMSAPNIHKFTMNFQSLQSADNVHNASFKAAMSYFFMLHYRLYTSLSFPSIQPETGLY